MQLQSITYETFDEISLTVKHFVLGWLGLDSSYLQKIQFRRDVEYSYTKIKNQAFREAFYGFTRVHNWKLAETLDPVTGCKTKILPSDFIGLIKGYDKQNNKWNIIYDTSFLNNINSPNFINYIRYVKDNDTKVTIPMWFHSYISAKLVEELSWFNKYSEVKKDPQFRLKLSMELNNARTANNTFYPFSTGIDYGNCSTNDH